MRKIKFDKSLNVALYVLAFLLVVGISYATVTDFNGVRVKSTGEETYQVEVQNSSGTRVYSVDSYGNVYIGGTLTSVVERGFTLPILGFMLTNGSPVSASTAPGLEVDNLIPNIVWSDGETTPVMITFRVPTDYYSGGAFRVIATESDSTTPNQIDFDVYVNRSGRAAASSASNQTPVALAGTTATPSVVTLTPSTDFSSLAAGDWVTLRIWRDDTATGTGDLEVKGVEFFYTATR